MWPGRTPSCGGRNFEDKLRSTFKKKQKQRALTGMRNLPFVLQCHRKGISTVAVCGKSCELCI